MPNSRICSIASCDKPVSSRGWCKMHYSRWWKNGDPFLLKHEPLARTCSVSGCADPPKARNLCSKHYARKNKKIGHKGQCSIEGCAGFAYSRELCVKHYNHWKKVVRENPKCCVEGCGYPAITKGMCAKHYCRSKNGADLVYGGKHGRLLYIMDVVLPFSGKECLIWPGYKPSKKKYPGIRINGRSYSVHRFVCEKAYGPPPTPKHHAAHRCGKGRSGCVNPCHLRWATPKENMEDKTAHGTQLRGEDVNFSKLKENDVIEMRRLRRSMKNKDIALMFGVHLDTVSLILRRKTWKHI